MDTPQTNQNRTFTRIARRTGKITLSLFIIWHAIGISVVGPAYTSVMRDNLMKIYGHYLAIINLDSGWPFYAPDPYLGSILSYETITNSDHRVNHPLSHARDKFDHAYFRYTNFYAYLFKNQSYSLKRGYDKSVARFLCSQHSSDVVAINFILQHQKRFTHTNYQRGYRPLDNEFLTTTVIGPYDC